MRITYNMIPANWKDRLIEQTKKEIIQEARDKLSARYSSKQSLSPEGSRLRKLEQLQESYEFLQRELKARKQTSSNSPAKLPSKTPDLSQSFPNSLSDSLTGLKQHLGQMQLLQKRAKEILDKERLANLASISESPVLTEKALRKKRLERVDMKIPVYVPLKSIRKERNLPPAMVNTVLPNGEVMPVYMVGDPSPMYNPMVRVNQSIPNQSNREGYKDSVDATAHSKQNVSVDSVFYYRIYKKEKNKPYFEDKNQEPENELTEPPPQKQFRPVTPTDNPHAWHFRELEKNFEKPKPKRKWVKDRMDLYSEKQVKQNFLPKIDPNKSLELIMLKERASPLRSFNKVKIFK